MTHNIFDDADHSVPVYAYDEDGNKQLLGRAEIDEDGEASIEFVGEAGKDFVSFISKGTLHELSVNAVTWTDEDGAMNVKHVVSEDPDA